MKNNQQAAKFVFSSPRKSYAANNLDGDIKNIGVIGYMAFDEEKKVNYIEDYSFIHKRDDGPTWFDEYRWEENNLPYKKSMVWYKTNLPRGGVCGQSSIPEEDVSYLMAGTNTSITASASSYNLGTEHGERTEFKTEKVNNKFSLVMAEKGIIYYDDKRGLIERGIIKKKSLDIDPFPGYNNKYCSDPIYKGKNNVR